MRFGCVQTVAAVVLTTIFSVTAARPITIGAPIVSAPWSASDLLKKSVEYLRWKLPETHFELVWTPVDALENDLNTGHLDLAVLPSAPLNPSGVGVGRVLAFVKSETAPNPDTGSACVIVTRQGTTLTDYRRLRFGADSALSVPGYLACAQELLAHGADFSTIENHTRFFGDRDTRRILRALQKTEIDVAFVRAGWAEDVFLANGRQPFADFSVLFAKHDSLTVRHSSVAYPSPTLVSGPRMSPDELQRILTALLTMPPDRLGAQWTIPAGSNAVNRLTRDLKIGPYDYLRHWTLQRVWREYRPWVIVSFLLLLALLTHGWLLEKLVRRRTADLTQALIQQRKAERLALEKTNELKRVEQKTAIAQLSSVFAHEVSGPISTLLNLTHSARLAIDHTLESDTPPTVEDLESADERLSVIESQIGKVGDIVSRVRNYAHGNITVVDYSLAAAVSAAAGSVTRLTGLTPTLTVEQDSLLSGDALETELIFVNLIKNAAEAVSNQRHPKVTIRIFGDDTTAGIDISDNGPELTQAAWQNLFARHRRSTKAEGLGLGLSLTTALIEKWGGTLQFIRRPEGGHYCARRISETTMTAAPLIRIVDDEADVRDSLSCLFTAEGWAVKTYASAETFLTEDAPSVPGCLVLDMQMPGLSGPELQETMAARGIPLPIVFFSGHGTMESAVRAMKKGAVNFLAKTVHRADLVSAVSEALSTQSVSSGLTDALLVAAYRRLTDLEKHVAQLAAAGLVNGDIAKKLGVTPKTVRNQKVLVKQKLGAETPADLIAAVKKVESLIHANPL